MSDEIGMTRLELFRGLAEVARSPWTICPKCKHPIDKDGVHQDGWGFACEFDANPKYGRYREVAQDCYDSLMMDDWPRPAARCDFGLDTADHLGALQFAIRSGATVQELCVVLGEGAKITALCRRYKDNAYGHAVTFLTAYDKMGPEPEDDE